MSSEQYWLKSRKYDKYLINSMKVRRERRGAGGCPPAPRNVSLVKPFRRFLTEQGEDGARTLVGDRQRLHAELLLGLQRLEVGALGREVGVDQLTDAAGQRVGQRLDEVGLGGDLVRCRAELAQRRLDLVDRRLDHAQIERAGVDAGGCRAEAAGDGAGEAGGRADCRGAADRRDYVIAGRIEGGGEAVRLEGGVEVRYGAGEGRAGQHRDIARRAQRDGGGGDELERGRRRRRGRRAVIDDVNHERVVVGGLGAGDRVQRHGACRDVDAADADARGAQILAGDGDRRGRDGVADAVQRGQHVLAVGAATEQIDAVELRGGSQRVDLIDEGGDVVLDGVVILRRILRLNDLGFDAVQRVRDCLRAVEGDVDERRAESQRVADRLETCDVAALTLRDGEGRSVVRGARDLEARADATLHLGQRLLGRVEGLEGSECVSVRVDRKHRNLPCGGIRHVVSRSRTCVRREGFDRGNFNDT